jgi:hypothetical protein
MVGHNLRVPVSKLGISNRTELAATATRRRPTMAVIVLGLLVLATADMVFRP